MPHCDADIRYIRLAEDEPDRLLPLLNTDEKQRASRFKVAHARNAFIVARAGLRILLGRYLGVAPGAVAFEYSPSGKPALVSGSLRFNLSHSGDLAAYVFAENSDVGIDIEQRRDTPDAMKIARHFFSDAECAALDTIDPSGRGDAFLRCWTRKEAYVKAVGEGLSMPLASFTVDIRPDVAPSAVTPGWWMYPLRADPQHIAALVLSAGSATINEFEPVSIADL